MKKSLFLVVMLVFFTAVANAQCPPPTITCSGPVTINTTLGMCTGTTTLTPPTVSFNCGGGLFGNALAFDGVNDYVLAPRPVQDDFTIEFWFSSTQNAGSASQWYGGRGMVDAEVAGATRDFGVSLGAGKVLFGTGQPDVTINSGVALNDGLWHHVAATRARSTGAMILYINGVLVSSAIGSTQSLDVPPNIRIGMLQTAFAAFSGKIDEVRIWNTVRTQAQISANMNTPFSGPLPPDLVTYYKLNSGIANGINTGVVTAIDETGNSNGTLNNFALSGSSSNWVLSGTSISNNAPLFYPTGNTTVTWTATDANGNSASCDQVVTVVDNQPPVITCSVPGINISKGTSSGGTARIVGYESLNGAYNWSGDFGSSCNEHWTPFGSLCDEAPNTDNPAASTKTNNNSGATWGWGDEGEDVGVAIGVLVIDLGSVQTFSRAQVFQMFSDGLITHIKGFYHPSISATPPAFNDAGWVQMFAETSVGEGVLTGNTVTSPTTINFNQTNARYVRYYVRNDGSLGNESWIELRSVKLFNPSSGVTANLPLGECSMPVNFSRPVTDNCPGTVVTYSPASGSFFCAGVTPVTVTATDASGNSANCTFNVTVVATGVATCVAPEINVTGNAVTILDGDATASATDGTDFGQQLPAVPVTHTFTIENNGAAPLIISSLSISGTDPSNFTIGGISTPLTLASGGSTSFTVTFSASSAGNFNAILNINNNDCDELLYDFALHAEVSSCQPAAFSVCPGNQEVNTSSNSCDAVVTYTVSTTGDPAPDISYAFTGATTGSDSGDGSSSNFNKGTTTVTLTVTNSCGTATCSFDVVVTDATPPTFTAPADITIPFTSTCDYDESPGNTGDVTDENDNCATGLEATYGDVVSQCGNNIVITRTWSLGDNSGNAAVNQVQIITVTDNSTDYIVYAMKEAKFGENNDFNGSVGVKDANGKADFKKNCDQAGTEFAKAKTVTIQLPSTINAINNTPALDGPNPPANPYAGGGLSGNHTQSIDGTVPAGNFKNLTIKKGVVAQVDGDNYGKLTIEENAIVTFTRSIIDMEDLNVKKGKGGSTTEVKFNQCTAVRIKDKVDIEEDTRINAAGGFKVTFYLGNKDFSVKADNVIVEANVLAPTGKLKITGGNGAATMSGWYIVEELHGDAKNVIWKHNTACGQLRGPVVATAASKNEPAVILPDAFKVNVFPNPTYTDFRLQVNSPSEKPVTVRIIDISGRTLKQIPGVYANLIITIGSELRGGTYFAEVIQGDNRKVLKLIKLN